MRFRISALVASAGLLGVPLVAQEVPTTQPNVLTVFVEDIKPGYEADHVRNESGWPAALAAHGSPYTYLALESLTGSPQVWYVSSYESYAQEGEFFRWQQGNAELQNELNRLWRADAQYLNGVNQFQAQARAELSFGAFPNIASMRYWQIGRFRVRPGHEQAFEAAVQTYIAAAERAGAEFGFRTYQVVAGMQGSNYLFFTSLEEWGDLDAFFAEGGAIGQAFTPEELSQIQNLLRTGVQFSVVNRFRLNPTTSYVDDATRATDPDFWGNGN